MEPDAVLLEALSRALVVNLHGLDDVLDGVQYPIAKGR
jgi:hypothetical protein